MDLCPYCEEDAALDASGDCPRCDSRHATLDDAAYYAETVDVRYAGAKHLRTARQVLVAPRDYPNTVVNWASELTGAD